MKVEDVPGMVCPTCGSSLDKAGSPNCNGASPRPGDITLCVYCGEIGKFDFALQMQKLNEEELTELKEEYTETFVMVKPAQEHFLRLQLRRNVN